MKNAGATPRKATATIDGTNEPPIATLPSLSMSAAATFANSAQPVSTSASGDSGSPWPHRRTPKAQPMQPRIATAKATRARAGGDHRDTTQKYRAEGLRDVTLGLAPAGVAA